MGKGGGGKDLLHSVHIIWCKSWKVSLEVNQGKLRERQRHHELGLQQGAIFFWSRAPKVGLAAIGQSGKKERTNYGRRSETGGK